MTIRLQGRWEPMRAAMILDEYAKVIGGPYADWATDAAARIRAQVEEREQEKATRK